MNLNYSEKNLTNLREKRPHVTGKIIKLLESFLESNEDTAVVELEENEYSSLYACRSAINGSIYRYFRGKVKVHISSVKDCVWLEKVKKKPFVYGIMNQEKTRVDIFADGKCVGTRVIEKEENQ